MTTYNPLPQRLPDDRCRTIDEKIKHLRYDADHYISMLKAIYPEIFRFLPESTLIIPGRWYAITGQLAEAVRAIQYRNMVYCEQNKNYYLKLVGDHHSDCPHRNHVFVQLMEELDRRKKLTTSGLYGDEPEAKEMVNPTRYIPEMPVEQIKDISFLAGYHYGACGDISSEKALGLFKRDNGFSLQEKLNNAAELNRAKARQREYEATEMEFTTSEPEKLTWFEKIFGRRI